MNPKADAKQQARDAEGTIEAGLLLESIEARVLAGDDLDRTRALLAREQLWGRLSPDDQLRWAGLAQMAEAARALDRPGAASDLASLLMQLGGKGNPERDHD